MDRNFWREIMEKIYDVAILGGGPGGITAGIYAKRAGLDAVIIEKNMPGGAISTTPEISNYTGFSSISGMELATKMFEHAGNFDIPFIFDEVKSVKLEGDVKKIVCFGQEILAKTVIISMGASVRKLNVVGEKKFIGKGVSYCATCDGNFFKGLKVAVVGGGNTALEDSLYLSNLASEVYLIHRRDEFSGQEYLLQKLKEKGNIHFVLNSVVSALKGKEKLSGVEIENRQTRSHEDLEIDGLFVCIGRGPDTEIFCNKLTLTEAGYIQTDCNMKTNIDGVFAIGDIRNTPLRQVITACSDGAIAATKAFEYIKSRK